MRKTPMGLIDKKVSIFLDTNVFQTFLGKKKTSDVLLYSPGVPNKYYALVDFINQNKLKETVEICIPSVVIMECKQHMYACFLKSTKELEDSIENYQKLFGDLISFDYEIKLSKEEYESYIDTLFEEFFSNSRNQCKLVHYGESEKLLNTLLTKALKGVKPFVTETVSGKSHSDAGFKDAIIAETIYEYCKANNRIGVFVSSDTDFAQPFESTLTIKSTYVQFHSIEKTIEALTNFFKLNPKEQIKENFQQNRYWHERLLNEIGIELDESVSNIVVTSVSTDDDKIFTVKMTFTVNEVLYNYSIQFDYIANDIITSHYKIEND